jgi:hypothetical protein
MLIFGGWDGFNGPFALSLSGVPTWTPANSAGGYLEGQTAIYDAARDRLVFFGGADFYREFSETRQLVWGTATAVRPAAPGFADALQPCYPNPFNQRVTIPFELHADGNAALSIFDVSGRLVKTLIAEWMPRGVHSTIWDGKSNTGSEVSSGVYFCRLSTEAFVQTRKIVMINRRAVGHQPLRGPGTGVVESCHLVQSAVVSHGSHRLVEFSFQIAEGGPHESQDHHGSHRVVIAQVQRRHKNQSGSWIKGDDRWRRDHGRRGKRREKGS